MWSFDEYPIFAFNSETVIWSDDFTEYDVMSEIIKFTPTTWVKTMLQLMFQKIQMSWKNPCVSRPLFLNIQRPHICLAVILSFLGKCRSGFLLILSLILFREWNIKCSICLHRKSDLPVSFNCMVLKYNFVINFENSCTVLYTCDAPCWNTGIRK